MIVNNVIMYFELVIKNYEKIIVYYVIGGPYVRDQAGLNRGPLIQNRFIVTLYILLVRIE